MVEPRPDGRGLDAIFHPLADPARRDVLEAVATEPRRIGTLAEPVDVSPAAVSGRVGVLEDAGVVAVDEDGRVRRYHLDPAPLGAAFGWLTQCRVFWEHRFDALATHLEGENET